MGLRLVFDRQLVRKRRGPLDHVSETWVYHRLLSGASGQFAKRDILVAKFHRGRGQCAFSLRIRQRKQGQNVRDLHRIHQQIMITETQLQPAVILKDLHPPRAIRLRKHHPIVDLLIPCSALRGSI